MVRVGVGGDNIVLKLHSAALCHHHSLDCKHARKSNFFVFFFSDNSFDDGGSSHTSGSQSSTTIDKPTKNGGGVATTPLPSPPPPTPPTTLPPSQPAQSSSRPRAKKKRRAAAMANQTPPAAAVTAPSPTAHINRGRGGGSHCPICCLTFASRPELTAHLATPEHLSMIMSDEGIYSLTIKKSRSPHIFTQAVFFRPEVEVPDAAKT